MVNKQILIDINNINKDEVINTITKQLLIYTINKNEENYNNLVSACCIILYKDYITQNGLDKSIEKFSNLSKLNNFFENSAN